MLDWPSVIFGMLATLALFLLCLAAVCLAGRWVREHEVEPAPPGEREPVDGRFCARCGGRLDYKQRRVVRGGSVTFLTVLVCPFCRHTVVVHEEPDYQRLRAPGED
jgi:hypothetical protein